MDIDGELVKDPFEMGDHIHGPLFEGVQHRHQYPSGVGPGIRLRPETVFAGDNRGPQVTFGKIVLGGYAPVVGPVIELVSVGPEDLLGAVNAKMVRWRPSTP